MTALERDLHLQELILQGNEEHIREFYQKERIDRPLSRALGYACRYGTPSIVQMLVDGGARVYYHRKADWIDSNGVAGGSILDSIIEPYLYLLGPDAFSWTECSRLQNLDKQHQRVRGDAYDEIVRILVQNAYKTGFDPSDMLFFAALYNDEDAMLALRKAGAARLYGALFELMSDKMSESKAEDYVDYMDEYYRILRETAVEQNDLRPLLRRLCTITDGPVRLRGVPWTTTGDAAFQQDGALRALMEYTTLGRHTRKREFLEYCVRNGCKETLEWALDNGWARSWKEYERLKEIAEETGENGELQALLLQKQHKSGFTAPRARSTNPFSAENLRRVWSTRKPENGFANSLEIFSYKGKDVSSEGCIVVPDHIGKRMVTCLARDTFDIFRPRSDEIKEARAQITELTIPGTIRAIPERLMSGHRKLRKITIGEGTAGIGQSAFSGCKALEKAVLPHSLKAINADAFLGCTDLRDVAVGEDVQISPRAFWGCSSLADKSGFIRIGGRIVAVDPLQMPAALPLMAEPGVYQPFQRLLPTLTYRLNSDTIHLPVRIPSNLRAGDDFTFGQFPYDTDYALQPLHWICVARKGDIALCITRDAIALLYGHWEQLDRWPDRIQQAFQDAYLPVMFSSEEQALLQKSGGLADNHGREMFLLYRDDIERHMPADSPVRRCSATPYAKAQFGRHTPMADGTWVAGDFKPDYITAVCSDSGEIVQNRKAYGYDRITTDSTLCTEYNDLYRSYAIRPAIHLRIPKPV